MICSRFKCTNDQRRQRSISVVHDDQRVLLNLRGICVLFFSRDDGQKPIAHFFFSVFLVCSVCFASREHRAVRPAAETGPKKKTQSATTESDRTDK